MRSLIPFLLLVCSSTALADGEIRVDVAVGSKKEALVEHARGWFCDDPSLVTADMVTRDAKLVSAQRTSVCVGSPIATEISVHQ